MASISFEDEKWRFTCDFSQKHIPKYLGFLWCPDKKIWWTKSLASVQTGKKYLTPQALEIFESVSGTKEFAVDRIAVKDLFPFQNEGVRHLQKFAGTILADEPGLGKTAQAITAMELTLKDCHPDFYSGIIICPPFLALNWVREFDRWAPKAKVQRLAKRSDKFESHKSVDYIIVPDSLIIDRKIQGQILNSSFHWGIIDEAHRYKNHGSKRTEALFGKFERAIFSGPSIANQCLRKSLLTGSPIPNRPIEIWPLLFGISPAAIDFKNYYEFATVYCDARQTKYGLDVSGSSNESELFDRLSRIMLRRTKREVMPQLPSRTKTALMIEPDRLEVKALDYEKKIKKDLSARDHITIHDEWAKTENMILGLFAEERRQLSIFKAIRAIEWATNFLEANADQKLLIFAWHKDAVHAIAAGLEAPEITGKTSMTKRQEIVDKFQNNIETRVIVANIQTLGVGFTLTKAQTVLFAEFSWVPGENEQAIDRCHRIGQDLPVTAHFLIYENSLDEYAFDVQKDKQKTIDKILGGKNESRISD